MPIGQDIQRLARNPWALAGVAGAAAVGGLVLYQRSRSGAAAAGDGTPVATSGVAALDTTGADMAAALSNMQASMQGMFDEYGRQLSDTLGTLHDQAPAPPAPVMRAMPVGRPNFRPYK